MVLFHKCMLYKQMKYVRRKQITINNLKNTGRFMLYFMKCLCVPNTFLVNLIKCLIELNLMMWSALATARTFCFLQKSKKLVSRIMCICLCLPWDGEHCLECVCPALIQKAGISSNNLSKCQLNVHRLYFGHPLQQDAPQIEKKYLLYYL